MRRTIDEWKMLFKQQEESGLSIPQFCLSKGIERTDFYRAFYRIADKNISEAIVIKPDVKETRREVIYYLEEKKVVFSFTNIEELKDILEVIKHA